MRAIDAKEEVVAAGREPVTGLGSTMPALLLKRKNGM